MAAVAQIFAISLHQWLHLHPMGIFAIIASTMSWRNSWRRKNFRSLTHHCGSDLKCFMSLMVLLMAGCIFARPIPGSTQACMLGSTTKRRHGSGIGTPCILRKSNAQNGHGRLSNTTKCRSVAVGPTVKKEFERQFPLLSTASARQPRHFARLRSEKQCWYAIHKQMIATTVQVY